MVDEFDGFAFSRSAPLFGSRQGRVRSSSEEDYLGRATAELLVAMFGSTVDRRIDAKIAANIFFDSSEEAHALRQILTTGDEHRSRARLERAANEWSQAIRQPGVRAVSLVERLQPSMNYASVACALPEFKRRTQLSGRGVLIGIVDSGIDASHPMFAGRIGPVWDQTTAAAAGGLPHGQLLTGATLGNCDKKTGHGTHVAGIAAGNDATFSGVAPEARLVVVKSDLDDDRIADALDWLSAIAVQADQPMVVNLSMESQRDPRDGSGFLCERINDLSRPGFIVCCASGNSGDEHSHTDVVIRPGDTVTIPFEILHSQHGCPVSLKGWADVGAELLVAIKDHQGGHWDPMRQPGAARQYVYSVSSGGADIDLVAPKSEPAFDGATAFLVSARAQGKQSIDGSWSIELTNKGSRKEQVHVWSMPAEDIRIAPTMATNRTKIAAPGAANRAITVGALVTRMAWEDDTGKVRLDDRNRPYQVASFSSPGPLRSGAGKPDLVAPGASICSARSTGAAVPNGYAVSKLLRIMAGSSMATPFIAGLVALMLEKDRSLTPEAAKLQLLSVCGIPGQPAGHFDAHWGHGFPLAVLL